jgi:hypothetical protein
MDHFISQGKASTPAHRTLASKLDTGDGLLWSVKNGG